MFFNRIFTCAIALVSIPTICLAEQTCDSLKTQASEAFAQYGVIKAALEGNQVTAKEFHLEAMSPKELQSLLAAEKSKIIALKTQAIDIAAHSNASEQKKCLEVYEGTVEFKQ